MKLTRYLKDRLVNYVVVALALALVMGFLWLFHVPPQASIACLVIMLAALLAGDVHEYYRRRVFYQELLDGMESLDQPHLISEMIEAPDFVEGELLCDALHLSTASANELVNSYRREDRAFREYIELWVHEIKVPLASLELMCHNDGNTRYLEQLGRLDDMVSNVLYYARSESMEKDYVIREVSLARTFSQVAVRYREQIMAADIRLETEGLDVSVMTDGKWLAYILGQLMSNAIKYVAPDRDRVVRVSATEESDCVTLRFYDNGIGIPASDLSRIFEKSFTGENGRIGANSTGMGLYLVAKLCERLGHTIDATSRQGEFTEVSIAFGKSAFMKLEDCQG